MQVKAVLAEINADQRYRVHDGTPSEDKSLIQRSPLREDRADDLINLRSRSEQARPPLAKTEELSFFDACQCGSLQTQQNDVQCQTSPDITNRHSTVALRQPHDWHNPCLCSGRLSTVHRQAQRRVVIFLA